MPTSYLLRFDDVCPGMNWDVWFEVERLLTKHAIMPILAVVPDNKDPKLEVSAPDAHFWDRVRVWKSRGWTIAVHGYQHRYVTQDAGIVGVNQYSEFAGLPFDLQLSKLQAAMAIFSEHGVCPDTWVAPAHSFDQNTLRALDEIGVTTISDGYSLSPHTDDCGRFWVPQQLWRFRAVPFGVWTVCLHINTWTDNDLTRFAKSLNDYASKMTNMSRLRAEYMGRRRGIEDAIFDSVFRRRTLIRRRHQSFANSKSATR